MDDKLPAVPTSISDDHPALWRAYLSLGKAASKAGPLDERTCRLVHLALAIGQGSEGATHSHARRAITEGLGEAGMIVYPDKINTEQSDKIALAWTSYLLGELTEEQAAQEFDTQLVASSDAMVAENSWDCDPTG